MAIPEGVPSRRWLGVGDGPPAEQQAAISNPTGGITADAEARTAINAILTALRNFGLIAE